MSMQLKKIAQQRSRYPRAPRGIRPDDPVAREPPRRSWRLASASPTKTGSSWLVEGTQFGILTPQNRNSGRSEWQSRNLISILRAFRPLASH